jgi:hypothetical protein
MVGRHSDPSHVRAGPADLSRMRPCVRFNHNRSRPEPPTATIALWRSIAQALQQPSLIAVKVVTWDSSLQLMAVRMGIKPCKQRRSGKTRKNHGLGFDRRPLRGRRFPEFTGETAHRGGMDRRSKRAHPDVKCAQMAQAQLRRTRRGGIQMSRGRPYRPTARRTAASISARLAGWPFQSTVPEESSRTAVG